MLSKATRHSLMITLAMSIIASFSVTGTNAAEKNKSPEPQRTIYGADFGAQIRQLDAELKSHPKQNRDVRELRGLLMEFEDYTGGYVQHCHILGHEDRGMMTLVQTLCPESEVFGTPVEGGADNCEAQLSPLPVCPP